MPTLKRILVLLLELVTEALLLGFLLGVLVSSQTGFLYGAVGSVLAVPVLLFLHGYYLTRACVGLAWRSQEGFLYPAVSAAVFVTHMYIALERSKADLSKFALGIEPWFLVGGACSVFACASGSNWLLRRCRQSRNEPAGILASG
jgi:hypothetical protein